MKPSKASGEKKNNNAQGRHQGRALWIRVLALILAVSMVLGILVVGVGSFGF
ncbi:hypothetical protein [Levyella massiliensis]|uniref:hypothetical protein n=1 Tax=Levyella massiliensis TaxID=938289 RepID=UPI000381071E|nr:hypothetical protein [Levyella massiliensis]